MRFVTILIPVLSILFPYTICLAQGKQPQVAQVIAHTVGRSTIADTVEALGTLRSNEGVTITANVTETIEKIHFTDGQVVAKGDLLLELNHSEQTALLEEAESRLSEAKRQYERLKPLKDGGSASASLIDERLREYETAKAQRAAIQSRLNDRIIRAPFAGVLGLRNISEGALVSPGTEIVTLDDKSVMKLDFSIPSTFLSTLKKGLRVTASSRDLPERQFAGTVESIDSRIDPITRSISIRALIDNSENQLKAGMLMSVRLLKNERNAVVIPEEAVITEGNKKFVFVIADKDKRKIIEKRQISGGERQPGTLEVLSGLVEKEEIVVHGTIKVRPGQEVTLISPTSHNDGIE